MSDEDFDGVIRRLAVSAENDFVQDEAMRAIETLIQQRNTAERASGIFEKDVVRLIGERDAAIKERDEAISRMSDKDFERTAAEIARDAAIARAEAAEARFNKAVIAGIEVGQERDALRALLREAGEAIVPLLMDDFWTVGAADIGRARDLLARIAAATGETHDDK